MTEWAAGRAVALGVDIGGTKLAAGLVGSDGRLLHRAVVPTPAADAQGVWQAVRGLVDSVRAAGREHGPVVGVGVGCGGPMRWPTGVVSPLNIPAWREFPLRERLAELVGDVPVRVHNDAVALAVAEHWVGAGRGVDNLLGMVVSTGVGGGLVLDGRVIDGAGGNAGHIGHVVVDPGGPDCACGGQGCLEAVASGPRAAAWAAERGWRPHPGADGVTLVRDAAAGDPIAAAAVARAGTALGVAIASAAHLCDLDLVAVGGGFSAAGTALLDPLRAAFERHARMDFVRSVRVVPAATGPGGGVIGAAALILAGDRYWGGGPGD